MKDICCIISAGDVNTTYLLNKKSEYHFFIAADAGYEKAKNTGIIPELAVGDFDSISQPLSQYTSSASSSNSMSDYPKFIQFPIEKDFSDTHLAIEEGIKLGYTHFHVYGALGGDRFSHSLANIQTLLFMKKKNVSVTLIGMHETIYLLHKETLQLTPPMHSTFSIFSLSDLCTGVTIEGGKYPLRDATLTNDFPLGISNESLNSMISISVDDGFLLVILEQ